jgi:hypothetical protein
MIDNLTEKHYISIEVIKNDEQFDYYYNWINNLSNFQALHDDTIDGNIIK